MKEKELLTRSGRYTVGIVFLLSLFWFLYSIQTSFGYSGTGTTQDLKTGSRFNGDLFAQPFNGSVTIFFGTQSTSPLGTGTTGHIGTDTSGLPKIRYSYTGGSSTITLDGFTHVAINGSDIPLIGSVAAKLDAVGGVGTGNTFNNVTIAGQGTTTATTNYNGANISPTEVSYLDGMSENISNKLAIITGSTTNHTHTGSDGTAKISHTDLTPASKGTQTHTQIDTFIAREAQPSGLATLDANSKVVQNPASGTSTPGVSKIIMSLVTGFLDDSWLSSIITKLGADIQLGTETTGNTNNISEGSTNKYYTDARVNAAVGSLSVNTLSDVNITMSNENDFVKIVGGQLVAGSSSTTVAFSEVTGSATASQLPLVSGLLGSATASQIPLLSELFGSTTSAQIPLVLDLSVLKLSGTTTQQAAGDFQLVNVQSNTNSGLRFPQGTQTGTQLLLQMHGTITKDSSNNNYEVTNINNVTGSTDITFNTGAFSAYFDGVDKYLTLADSAHWTVGTTGTTMRLKFRTPTPAATMRLLGQTGGGGGLWRFQTQGGALLFYKENVEGNPVISISGGTILANTIHYAEVVKAVNANSMYLFLDGNLVAQGTITQSFGDSNSLLYIGINGDGSLSQDFNGYMKDIEILQGVALHTASFEVNKSSNYALATMNRQALCSTDGIERIVVQTFATDTTRHIIIFNNGSLTAHGYGSESGMSATSSVYSTESLNAELATNFVIKSKDNKGRNFQKLTETCLDKVVNVNLWSWNPINHKNINRLEAEAIAKEAFVKQGKQDWELLHADEYILATTVNGTETAIIRDYARMEKDYKYYIELEWAYSLEQAGWIDTVKDNLESDTTLRRRGFRYDDSTTPEELKEPGGIGLSEATALSFKAIQELEAIVGSLSTTLKNQEIAYNEEVDNLYNLINAIIVALIAVGGGASGWATIRRKRKGT